MWIDLSLFADPDKTEKATPRKRQKAREEGQVSQSKDLNSAAALLAVSVAVYFTFGGLYRLFGRILVVFSSNFSGASSISVSQAMMYLSMAFGGAIGWLMLIMAAGIVGAAVPSILQTRFSFSLKSIMPDLNKLNPLEGLKRMFSMRSVMEFLKSLLKMAIIGYIGYTTVSGAWSQYFNMAQESLETSSIFLGNMIYQMMLKLGLALLVIGIADIYYQRWEFERSLKMSKKEVKDEAKDYDTNPMVKNKQREKMMTLARSRMMQNIANADVVVTNPTHFAVALEYKEWMDAPRVVAKGAGEIAERIKKIAREYKIPVLRNPPLARDLFKSVNIGDEVPSRLYKLIAELLVTVYKMKNSA